MKYQKKYYGHSNLKNWNKRTQLNLDIVGMNEQPIIRTIKT